MDPSREWGLENVRFANGPEIEVPHDIDVANELDQLFSKNSLGIIFSPSPSPSCSMTSVLIIARITRIFTIFYLPWPLIRLWNRFSKVIRMTIDNWNFLIDEPFDAY